MSPRKNPENVTEEDSGGMPKREERQTAGESGGFIRGTILRCGRSRC